MEFINFAIPMRLGLKGRQEQNISDFVIIFKTYISFMFIYVTLYKSYLL